MARCKSERCRAPLVWGVTIAGKRMPLDVNPIDIEDAMAREWKGVYTFAEDGSANIAPAGPLAPGMPLYLSHFATCPDSAGFHRAAA